jgi:hypothetical protein
MDSNMKLKQLLCALLAGIILCEAGESTAEARGRKSAKKVLVKKVRKAPRAKKNFRRIALKRRIYRLSLRLRRLERGRFKNSPKVANLRNKISLLRAILNPPVVQATAVEAVVDVVIPPRNPVSFSELQIFALTPETASSYMDRAPRSLEEVKVLLEEPFEKLIESMSRIDGRYYTDYTILDRSGNFSHWNRLRAIMTEVNTPPEASVQSHYNTIRIALEQLNTRDNLSPALGYTIEKTLEYFVNFKNHLEIGSFFDVRADVRADARRTTLAEIKRKLFSNLAGLIEYLDNNQVSDATHCNLISAWHFGKFVQEVNALPGVSSFLDNCGLEPAASNPQQRNSQRAPEVV